MSFNQFGKNVKQESSFDDEQRLMCSVSECGKRWTVHVSGDKPKCSKHQWEEKTDYSIPNIAKPVSQTIQQWYEKEIF
jgi:hypothetical protein